MTQVKSAQISKKNFSIYSHRGFGEKAHARYADTKRLRYVYNQLSGLELGIENGADTLEIDLSKTNDGKIVTAHGNPLLKYLSDTEQEYLNKHPESLTFQELLDWIYHQPLHINLYMELKSPISLKELLQEIDLYAEKKTQITDRLYQQLTIYTHDLQRLKSLINEKQHFGLSTLQLRIFWVSMGFIEKVNIDLISQIGTKECKIYGIEQGTVPWGFRPFVNCLNLPLPPFHQINKRLRNMHELVNYAHGHHLKFIIGTVEDTKLIRILIKQKIDGIVPNNPSIIYATGITLEDNQENKQINHYVPQSMKDRLHLN